MTVYILDYGYHASLALPAETAPANDNGHPNGPLPPRQYVEFAYGQWAWFALGDETWLGAIPALLIPQSATLGRRDLPGVSSATELANYIGVQTAIPIRVDAEKAAALRERLQVRWDAQKSRAHYHANSQMTFVPDMDAYWWRHDCNVVLFQWLYELDCRVWGAAPWAEFVVE